MNTKLGGTLFLKNVSHRYRATCGLLITLVSGCSEQPDPSFSTLAMYQSLEHKEVVIIEIKKDEPQDNARTLRISLGDDYSQWTQEIVTTTIRTGGENIASDNIKGKWLTADTLSLCLSGIDDSQQGITVDVINRTHSISPASCAVVI